MTTTHRNDLEGGRTARRAALVAKAAALGTLIGALPGVILVLVAQFIIDGEMQLTVGAPGFLLAFVGGAAGLVTGARRGLVRQTP